MIISVFRNSIVVFVAILNFIIKDYDDLEWLKRVNKLIKNEKIYFIKKVFLQ
jgi:hypothetical protein